MYAVTILIAAIFYFLIFFMLKEEKASVRNVTKWEVVGKAKFPIWLWLLCFVFLFIPLVNVIGMFCLLAFLITTTDDGVNNILRYTLFGLHLKKEV